MDFTTGKNDKDFTSMSMVDHHEINAREFFVPTQVLLISTIVCFLNIPKTAMMIISWPLSFF